jgi:predicted transposase YdaD
MQIDIKQPHDSIFKNVFDDIKNTKDFLKAYLPTELVEQIDFDTMKHTPTEKRDIKANKTHFDLSVDCLVGDKKSRVYILFEHKSYKEKQTIIQILRYCLVLWENELRNSKKNLTPVIPFVFYHGDTPSGLHDNFSDYFDVEEWFKKYLLDFKMVIFDTTKIKDNEIREKMNSNAFVMTSILLMKNIFEDVDSFKPVIKSIIELNDERKIMLFEYIAIKKDLTEDEFNDIIIDLKGDKEMPSLAEVWMERGEIRGRLNEIYNGIKRGLIFKFEQLGESLFLMTQKIEDIEKLQKIQDALLVINDADEFKRFIQKQQ